MKLLCILSLPKLMYQKEGKGEVTNFPLATAVEPKLGEMGHDEIERAISPHYII